MTDFTVLAKFRNRKKAEALINKIKARGYSCYNFFDKPANPQNPDG